MNSSIQLTHLVAAQGKSEAHNEAYEMVRRISTGVLDAAMLQELMRCGGLCPAAGLSYE